MSVAGPEGPSLVDPPSAAEFIALRVDIFRASHALVNSLEWYGYRPDVIDVVRVAEFLTEEGS